MQGAGWGLRCLGWSWRIGDAKGFFFCLSFSLVRTVGLVWFGLHVFGWVNGWAGGWVCVLLAWCADGWFEAGGRWGCVVFGLNITIVSVCFLSFPLFLFCPSLFFKAPVIFVHGSAWTATEGIERTTATSATATTTTTTQSDIPGVGSDLDSEPDRIGLDRSGSDWAFVLFFLLALLSTLAYLASLSPAFLNLLCSPRYSPPGQICYLNLPRWLGMHELRWIPFLEWRGKGGAG